MNSNRKSYDISRLCCLGSCASLSLVWIYCNHICEEIEAYFLEEICYFIGSFILRFEKDDEFSIY